MVCDILRAKLREKCLTLLALSSFLFRLRGIVLHGVSTCGVFRGCTGSYIVLVRLLVLITVITEVIILLVILEVLLVKVFLIKLLESESLTREPVDGTRNQLLLDILAQLVVQLEALLNVGCSILVVLSRCLGRGEEVEERLCWNGLLDDAGLLRV